MSLTAFAQSYARHGWPVFPLWPIHHGRCACPDHSCDAVGKHPVPPNWQHTIASAVSVDSAWAPRFGERGIGLACGERAGMWVLDVDPGHGGAKALGELQAEYGQLPDSLRVITGGAGMHVYFAWPDDGLALTNANGLPAGLDVRGDGGYVVLPPSLHASGRRYEWAIPPKAGKLEPAPGWLLELVRQRQRSLFPPVEDGELVPIGRRHEALVGLLGLMRSWGATEPVLTAAAAAFFEHMCEHDPAKPNDAENAARTARSIARYPPRGNR